MGQSGYMTSPRYPHVYSPDLDCSVTISVEANTNFMVTILGSDLPSDTCSDRLKISPSNGQFTEFCEQVFLLPVQMNFSFHNSGDIEFRFSTRPDTTHHHKGFSLRFDKTPLPPGQQTTTGTTNSPGIVTIVTRKKIASTPSWSLLPLFSVSISFMFFSFRLKIYSSNFYFCPQHISNVTK